MTARPVMVAVQAMAGREDMTRATIGALDVIGGAGQLPIAPVLCWTGIAPPPFALPPGWTLCHWEHEPQGHRRDLWRIMELTPPSCDLVVFEDDVIPCRNAVPYIAAWAEDCFTTFFNMRRLGPGRRQIDKLGFWGSQAYKVPGRLVSRFLAAGDTAPKGLHHGGDTRMGLLLQQWGEPVWYHRSLVQHVGERSVDNPSATLTGLRAPADDFDPELDALTLSTKEIPMVTGRKCPKCDKLGVTTSTCPRCRFDLAAHDQKQAAKTAAAAAATAPADGQAREPLYVTVPADSDDADLIAAAMHDLADAIRGATRVARDAIELAARTMPPAAPATTPTPGA